MSDFPIPLMPIFQSLVAVVVMSVFSCQSLAKPSDGAPQPKPDRYLAELPGGLQVEFVGLAPGSADSKVASVWWKPDGVKLGFAPKYRGGRSVGDDPPYVNTVIRVHGTSDTSAVTATAAIASTDNEKNESGKLYVAHYGHTDVPEGRTTRSFQVGVASEPLSPMRLLNLNGQRLPAPADSPADLVAEDVAFAVELENVGDKPIKLQFDSDGKRSGIQRVPADDTPTGLRTLLKPAFLLPGHSNMMCVGFDRNDTELVAVSAYHFATVRRCDVAARKLTSEINLASDKPLRPFRQGAFKLSGDRRRVIAATDEFVGIWDTSTGDLLKKLPFPARHGIYDCSIDKLDCTPDLSVIVGNWAMPGRLTLFYDSHVMIWDGNSGQLLQTVIDKHATVLISIDLSADGKLLATSNGSGTKVWETSTGKLLRSFPNDNKGRKHSDPEVSDQYTHHVWSVQLSPDGKQIAVGDILGVRLWDIQTGEMRHQLDAPYRYSSGNVTLVFSKDGQLLARTGTSGKDEGKFVPIWSTQTGEKLFELRTWAHCGAFSDDNKRFAVGLSERQMALAVWNLSGNAADAEPADQPGQRSSDDQARATYLKTPAVGQYKLTHTIALRVDGPKVSGDGTSGDWKSAHVKTGRLDFEIVDGSRLVPGTFGGVSQEMRIAADGSISYGAGNNLCKMKLYDDDRLMIGFEDDNQISMDVTLPLVIGAGDKRRAVWSAEIDGDVFRATAIPCSTRGCVFRLEKRRDGKLIHGSQQFFAVRSRPANAEPDERAAPLNYPNWRVDQKLRPATPEEKAQAAETSNAVFTNQQLEQHELPHIIARLKEQAEILKGYIVTAETSL